jgi:peptide/nickel transport system ATP-binding protein
MTGSAPSPSPAAPLLDVRDLTVSYRSTRGELRAVTDVSFSIMPGEVIGLVGESGSGKSTVAMAVLDLLGEDGVIESGEILFENQNLQTLSAGKRRALLGDRIGAVFQDPFTSLNPALTIGQQIAEPLIRHRGLTARQAMPRVEELLVEVGIREPGRMARSYPHQLSGGMQQRALIATAISCNPKLLILDEPTTALDVTVEAKIIELLAGLCDRHKLAALFVSHNLGVVNRLCGSICVLYGSQIVETGKTDDVLARPVHPYTKGLIAALPRMRLAVTAACRRFPARSARFREHLRPACSRHAVRSWTRPAAVNPRSCGRPRPAATCAAGSPTPSSTPPGRRKRGPLRSARFVPRNPIR